MLGLKIHVPDGLKVPKGRRRTGMQGDTFRVRVPLAMASNIYDACQLMAGLLPRDIEEPVSMPHGDVLRRLLGRSFANIKD